MRVKIQAGAELDMLNESELRKALAEFGASWRAEAAMGIKFPRFTVQGTIVGGSLDIGGEATTGDLLGPDPGFVWDVRRVRITGLNTADVVSMYINDPNPSQLVADTSDVTKRLFLFSEHVILTPGDALRFVGTGLVATGPVTISGQVREAPVSLAWRFGG